MAGKKTPQIQSAIDTKEKDLTKYWKGCAGTAV